MTSDYWPYVIGVASFIWLVLWGVSFLCRMVEDVDEEDHRFEERHEHDDEPHDPGNRDGDPE